MLLRLWLQLIQKLRELTASLVELLKTVEGAKKSDLVMYAPPSRTLATVRGAKILI
jgi:hypothetical protein